MEIEEGIRTFTDIFLNLLIFLIIIRVILSWLRRGFSGPIANFVYSATEPVFNLARKLPHRFGMIDFSPIIALFGVDLFHGLLNNFIYPMLFNAPL